RPLPEALPGKVIRRINPRRMRRRLQGPRHGIFPEITAYPTVGTHHMHGMRIVGMPAARAIKLSTTSATQTMLPQGTTSIDTGIRASLVIPWGQKPVQGNQAPQTRLPLRSSGLQRQKQRPTVLLKLPANGLGGPIRQTTVQGRLNNGLPSLR